MLTPRLSEKDLASGGRIFNLPDVIADHTLLRCIGEGSYGRVYLAQNQLTGVYRALKVVFREAFRDSRPYLREFDAICRFEPVSRSHAAFVQILHVGKLENAFYYIMELADDAMTGPLTSPEAYVPRTLGLNRGEILPIEQCVEIGARLAEGLSVLHEQNLIHRDIKPSNIIFVKGQPKLADIGLVTQIDEAKSFVGTAGFMPPEGPTTPAADIYSLGKVLYEIATGKDRCEFPQLPSDITAENALDLELNQIVLRACHPEPDKRYKSARELRHELDLLQAGRSIKRLRQVEKRLRVVKFAFAASMAVALAAFLIYYQVKSRREQAERERQRQAGYLLAEGTSHMRKGYLGHALPFYIRASEYDPSDMRSHQLRIGSLVAHAPNLALRWSAPRNANFSADGKWLAAPKENSIVIFESDTGRPIKTNLLAAPVSFAKFSPDRANIAAALGETIVLLTINGDKIAEHTFPDSVVDIAFSPGERRLAVALKDGQALFLRLDTGAVQDFPGKEPIRSITYDSKGERMITTDVNGHFGHIRDADGNILSRRVRLEYPYRGVFSPDGSIAIFCGWAAAVPVLVPSGELAGDTMRNDDAVLAAAYSPGAKVIATANFDATVRLWNATNFNALAMNHVLEHKSRPEKIAFIDETTLVAHCLDGETYVWNLGTRPPLPAPIPRIEQRDLLRVETSAVNLEAIGRTVTGNIGTTDIDVQFRVPIQVLAVSPRNDAFAVGAKDPQFDVTSGMLYRLPDLKEIPLNHNDGINHITFSHSGEKLVTCSEDFSAIIWDARTGKQLTQPMRHSWQVMYAAFSSDDRWLVTAGAECVCIVWNVSNGEPLTTPFHFPRGLHYVAFEPDDRGIVVSTKEGDFRMDLPFAELPLRNEAQYLENWIEPAVLTRF